MSEKIIKATHGSPDHPLRIGDVEIPCYVLQENNTGEAMRVITQRGLQIALGMSTGGGLGALKLARITENLAKSLRRRSELERESIVHQGKNADLPTRVFKLAEALQKPILFQRATGHNPSYGYEATILADFCDVLLAAREADVLSKTQLNYARQAEILVRGFARVGIIALVDEATGYQEIRDKVALQEILARYISGELLEWAKMFPDEFYKELFRLHGWQYHNLSVKRPALVGKRTVDLVYKRLAPGVYAKLRLVNPKNDKGRLKHTYHQWLTDTEGKPALDRHIFALTMLMKSSPNWDTFMRMVNRSLPIQSQNLPLPGVDWGDTINE